jgi:hypothetical protein
VNCRDARPGDLDFLVRATMGNAWETEHLKLDEAIVRKGVRKLLDDPVKGRAFVVEETVTSEQRVAPRGRRKEPLGKTRIVASLYVTFEWSDWHAAWYWWIQSLYVVPERRGQGVYTRLYKHVQAAARLAGDVRSIRLYVEESNENGLRAYRGHGMDELPYVVFEQRL